MLSRPQIHREQLREKSVAKSAVLAMSANRGSDDVLGSNRAAYVSLLVEIALILPGTSKTLGSLRRGPLTLLSESGNYSHLLSRSQETAPLESRH